MSLCKIGKLAVGKASGININGKNFIFLWNSFAELLIRCRLYEVYVLIIYGINYDNKIFFYEIKLHKF